MRARLEIFLKNENEKNLVRESRNEVEIRKFSVYSEDDGLLSSQLYIIFIDFGHGCFLEKIHFVYVLL